MKIVICTTPIRPEPTSYPPFGSLALMQSLRQAGHDPYFYDIDGLRPDFEETIRFFKEQSPDVVGISAVVSTAYAYTKELSKAIKKVSPDTKIVVGGSLAASSEILLRFCEVDACAIGEGERLIVNLADYWKDHRAEDNFTKFKDIKGITYLDQNGDMVFTGYEVAIPADEFLDPDWSILEKYSKIENYITDPLERYDFAQDIRSYEPQRQGKKLGTVVTAKGCVARCTFCHRWDRGYRHWSVDSIMAKVQHLMDQYNVGFVTFGDENFGSDRKKLDELIERLTPLGILWKAGGTRVRSVDQDLLHRMRESGCIAVYYGMETGSQRILEVMEKNTTLGLNVDAARWTHEAGMYSIYQMVLGMPGEDTETIGETSKFIQAVTEFLPEPPHKRLSLNYIQALPGTPVYEYARNIGAIGNTMEDEERYLLSVSDIDASDDQTFLNFTKHPYFTVQSWRTKIVYEAESHWYKNRGWKPAPTRPLAAQLNDALPDTEADEDFSRGGYFNLVHGMIRHPIFYRLMSWPASFPFRRFYPILYNIAKDFMKMPKKRFFAYTREYLTSVLRLKRSKELTDPKSLRQVMKDRTPAPESKSEASMLPLRDGR